jgi:hypothetical protein
LLPASGQPEGSLPPSLFTFSFHLLFFLTASLQATPSGEPETIATFFELCKHPEFFVRRLKLRRGLRIVRHGSGIKTRRFSLAV